MARLRFLLVLDFEATCDDTTTVIPRGQSEIIELPTLLYDLEQDKVTATFHEYVRPVHHPTLTPFCTNLTGIEQTTVDSSETFPPVWKRFLEFLREHGVLEHPEAATFLTCGDWDLKTMLPQQLRSSDLPMDWPEPGKVGAAVVTGAASGLPPPFDRWINIKKEYRELYGLRSAQGMDKMLRHAGMKLEGRHHSGIDDCKNILRLVQRMRADGWKPQPALPR
ncbi:exonuclease RNase T and DNA polymerase III [Epithele typhae]|uniref:exonuclease RNase T and DNA polymerase III n=1 Tax=Epithele typhae TaxID=378194 RepID=UPI00200793CF|nr:exonuclease RNase T and DNA polymerase III [Epithele typhae]KAH9944065.1 exonuclease RNase T and DNA polymerase III [Epithele typhae]